MPAVVPPIFTNGTWRHQISVNVAVSGGATSGRTRSNALAKKLLPWLAPWLSPRLTEIFNLWAFAKFAANELPYDRTGLEMAWLS